MLTSVQFDDEILAWSIEVYDVVANSVLVSKMDIAHAMGSQVCPEFGFWFGHFTVKSFCAREDFWCGAFMHRAFDPLCPSDISPN